MSSLINILKASRPGFTLAELLIALAILGVIATFTIPKILDSGSDGKLNAMAKETASTVAGAFSSYKLENTVTVDTNVSDLTPYMNYVSVTSANEAIHLTWATLNCTSSTPCLTLHNGGYLRYYNHPSREFGGTNSTNIISFQFDPDGPGMVVGVEYYITFNGRLSSSESWSGLWQDSSATGTSPIGDSPTWFSWSN